MLAQLIPKAQSRYRALPILGGIVETFADWSRRRGYTLVTIRDQLGHIKLLAHRLRQRGVRSLGELKTQDLEVAWRRFHKQDSGFGGTIRQIRCFLVEQGVLSQEESATSPSDLQLAVFAEYLRNVRGLAQKTVLGHMQQIGRFLRFLRFDSRPTMLGGLQIKSVDAFLRHVARTNNRLSLQMIVASIRAFLRFQYTQRAIRLPLHLQIDRPRVYRQETLPKAWRWDEIQALLRSIDRSDAYGLRDLSILYLAAAYGLRSCELVRLTLDDIDWRNATIQIVQTKTRQILRLPLTDEAGDILQQYLRKGRKSSEHRELFLRLRAPDGRLHPSSIHNIINYRIRRSGLDIRSYGTHAFRHAFAVRLLRQGVSMKSIGDTLGHRHVDSTATYLRLSVEDLRDVGLAVPAVTQGAVLRPPGWRHDIPRIRSHVDSHHHRIIPFRSHWAASLRRYLATKQALGRQYAKEARVLQNWDAFVSRFHPQSKTQSAYMFHGWAKGLAHLSGTEHRNRLRIVRNFLLSYARDHAVEFIPQMDSFPRSSVPCRPHIVSEAQMARVLATVVSLRPSHRTPLRAEKARLAFILLFCCGLRRGELLRLRVEHIDQSQRLLRVEDTKFHKSRWVPMSDSVFRVLQDYLDLCRRKGFPLKTGSFLIWSRESPELQSAYTGVGLSAIWQRVSLSVGIVDKRGRPPRIHDLRHSFAVNALQRWYAQGANVQVKLPYLATYMGHICPVSTYYYLQLTPQLGDAASQRFHALCAPLFQQGDHQ